MDLAGGFLIGGRPLLLGAEPQRRAQDEQQDADTGRRVWDGAVVLAKLLEQNVELVRGKRVLEVGAGRGVAGLAAARLGAASTVLTDLPYCLETLREAAQLNGDRHVEVEDFDWFQPEDFVQREGKDFDVVLAADVIWLQQLVEPLAGALHAVALRSPNVQIVVVHQTRSEQTQVAFLEAMAAAFELQWELPGGAPVSWHPDFVPDHRIRCWCFRLRAA